MACIAIALVLAHAEASSSPHFLGGRAAERRSVPLWSDDGPSCGLLLLRLRGGGGKTKPKRGGKGMEDNEEGWGWREREIEEEDRRAREAAGGGTSDESSEFGVNDEEEGGSPGDWDEVG